MCSSSVLVIFCIFAHFVYLMHLGGGFSSQCIFLVVISAFPQVFFYFVPPVISFFMKSDHNFFGLLFLFCILHSFPRSFSPPIFNHPENFKGCSIFLKKICWHFWGTETVQSSCIWVLCSLSCSTPKLAHPPGQHFFPASPAMPNLLWYKACPCEGFEPNPLRSAHPQRARKAEKCTPQNFSHEHNRNWSQCHKIVSYPSVLQSWNTMIIHFVHQTKADWPLESASGFFFQ